MSSSQVNSDAKDIIRIILQYLKENHLQEAHDSLQKEAGIALNIVDNFDLFISDIKYGRWDSVLNQLKSVSISREKLIMVYEQVILELIEFRELELAKHILRSTEPMKYLKNENMERYMKLEHLVRLPYFNASDAYDMGMSKEKKREEIASAISTEISIIPSSRLLSLLGQAMKYQYSLGLLPKGASFDLFKGDRKTSSKDIEDRLPKKPAGQIKFTIDSHPETVNFTPDGLSLVTGSVDGFIEVWDYENCKLRTDLEYQAKEELMMHEEAVLCCCFNATGELLATGSQGGKIKVWKISTGDCLRKLTQAHTQGITCIVFSKDGTQLLSTSFDSTARIHGLKSGKTIKEFRGHTSYVNCAVYTKDSSSIITGSSDGTCKVWDIKTTECLFAYRPGYTSSGAMKDSTINSLHLLPTNPDHMIVNIKGYEAFLVHTTGGQLIRVFSSGKQSQSDFICATISPQGKWLYCGAEDGNVYMFDIQTGNLEHVLEAAPGKEIIGVTHHPFRNLLTTITDSGQLTLWKP